MVAWGNNCCNIDDLHAQLWIPSNKVEQPQIMVVLVFPLGAMHLKVWARDEEDGCKGLFLPNAGVMVFCRCLRVCNGIFQILRLQWLFSHWLMIAVTFTHLFYYIMYTFPSKMCHINKYAFIVLNKADISIASPFHAIPWLLSFKPGRAFGTHTILW